MSDDPLEHLNVICSEVGFDLGHATPELSARLRLLATHGQTVVDCERMAAMARALFAFHAAEPASRAFTQAERRIVVLGCVLSDIGKTGPRSADAEAQRMIAEMFAVEGVRDERQTVSHFFDTFFAKDASERRQRFSALGLDAEMTLRAFWNLHSSWTLEILENSSVPREAVAAAATHHLLDEVNPGSIVSDDERFSRPFGDNAAFDRAEKLIILLDKYDALRRRGGQSHHQATQWLRGRVQHSARFHDDEEFSSLVADIEVALGPG